MEKRIEKLAVRFKELDTEIEELVKVRTDIERELKDYARENRISFDDNDQMRFENGVFIGIQRTRKLQGGKDDMQRLRAMLKAKYGDSFETTKINEKAVIEAVKDGKIDVFRMLEKQKISIATTEVFKIYC